MVWVLIPLLSVSFENVLIGFMCRYIYLHMKHIIPAEATSGTIGNALKVADNRRSGVNEPGGGAVETCCRGPGIESGPMFRPPRGATPKPSAPPATKCPSDAGTPPLEARCQIAIQLQG